VNTIIPEIFENFKLIRNECFRSGGKLDGPGTVKNDGCAGIFFNESGHISVIYELDQIKTLSNDKSNPRNHRTLSVPLVEKKANICFTKMVIRQDTFQKGTISRLFLKL
jgi:hypothetical protein